MAQALTLVMNWKEISAVGKQIQDQIEGLYLERVFIPARPRFPKGFLLGEMAMGFSGKKEISVLFSLRSAHPYLYLTREKLKVATDASRAGFDLALHKNLNGVKIDSVQIAHRERVILFWFTSGSEKLGLVLSLIPARPEGFLVKAAQDRQQGPWNVLLSSRALKKNEDAAKTYTPPTGERAPDTVSVRQEFFSSPDSLAAHMTDCLDREAFQIRKEAAERILKDSLKTAATRLKQSKTALREASGESDWQRFGDLLKAALGGQSTVRNGFREVLDFESETKVKIPSDPKLSAVAQVEKFFSLAKRRNRRISEATNRIHDFEIQVSELEAQLKSISVIKEWTDLEHLERTLGLRIETASPHRKRQAAWPGKSFLSKDGLPIWVGRSKDENLELTFKAARGNDLWLHLRGRPSAHAIVQLPQGKSAPLETLLDAAALIIHYSGGKDWGKTEVDYTFKKYVKRIKDSTEASYTNNKTLNVEVEPARLKRLLSVTDGQK